MLQSPFLYIFRLSSQERQLLRLSVCLSIQQTSGEASSESNEFPTKGTKFVSFGIERFP